MADVDKVKPLEGANTLGRTPSPWPLRRYSQFVGAYTRRQLTYPSDILNAFMGIAKAMAASMASTRMFYATPAVVFDWAILWTGHLTLKNLKRYPEFPSWAWAGWQGEISMAGDIYSAFDQHWLLERTWIEWYIDLDNGETVLIWESRRDKSIISTLITNPSGPTLDGRQQDSPDVRPEKVSSMTHTEIEGEISETEEENDARDESDEEDGEDDEDICPTYGVPSSNNPYGRNLKSRVLSALPEQPESKELQPSNGSWSSPGTLVFSTVVTTFMLESTSSPTKGGMSIFKIRDFADRICGFIWEDAEQTTLAKPLLQAREIILLSQASPGTTYMISGEEVGFADEYRQRITRGEALEALSTEAELDGEDILNEWHSWDFFNVMLLVRMDEKIESCDDERCVYERGGIGFLHKNALAHALDPKPCWRMVHLR
jgi:hypothetical protein